MDVLASIGLHNLVELVKSRLTHPSKPPSYDAATCGVESTSRTIPPISTMNSVNSIDIYQRPQTPPRIRMPTEHESLPNQPSASCYNDDSIPASIMSLDDFNLDGKTGISLFLFNAIAVLRNQL